MFILKSPLEQFDVLYLFTWFGFDIANVFFYFFLIIFFLILMNFFFKGHIFFSSLLQKIIEGIYYFILEMLNQQTGKYGMPYFPFLFTIFCFILFSNVLGMLPFSFTLTAHIIVTFFLALSFNLAFISIGVYYHDVHFLNLFKPSGVPTMLLPLIVVIEVISYLIRTLSLSVRLFANMLAGHCLLFVISSFVFALLNTHPYLGIVPFALVYLAVFLLEFSIAFLQAYVFTILLCIYLNDSLHPGH